MKALTVLMAMFCVLANGSAALADEGKDESGRGKERHEERHGEKHGDRRNDHDPSSDRRGGSYFQQYGYTRIPNGHLPPPGMCRLWYPDRPAGHQPPPFPCSQPNGRIEPGGWLMAPGPAPQEIQVTVYDSRRPGFVVDVGIFDARTGAMIRIQGAR